MPKKKNDKLQERKDVRVAKLGSRSGRYSTGSLVESIFHQLEMTLLREIIHPHRSHCLLLIPGGLPQTIKGCSRGLSFNW
jgi:hypothetical protein